MQTESKDTDTAQQGEVFDYGSFTVGQRFNRYYKRLKQLQREARERDELSARFERMHPLAQPAAQDRMEKLTTKLSFAILELEPKNDLAV